MKILIGLRPLSQKTPLVINAFYQIFNQHGVTPFYRAGKRLTSNDPIMYYYIGHRIKREALPMNTKAEWTRLVVDLIQLGAANQRRYQWMQYTIDGKWDCLTLYGCANPSCPEKASLIRLKKARVKGVRDSDIEDRLDRWGSKCQACSACQQVSYCKTTCQKSHWQEHKSQCTKSKTIGGRTRK